MDGPDAAGPVAPQGEPQRPEVAEPEVALIGYTVFRDPGWFPEWRTDGTGDAARLIEFAGRLCYLSFANPLGRTNQGYIDHLLQQGHFSVIEHATAALAIRGVSRSLTHELVRHRHLSFSQLSQRYVSAEAARVVVPEELQRQGLADAALQAAAEAQRVYGALAAALDRRLRASVPDRVARRKLARQAARCVLPNMTETMLVVSGNLRAWAGFLRKRGAAAAEPEIRRLAIQVHRVLMEVAPEVFGHFQVRELEGGVRVLETDVAFE